MAFDLPPGTYIGGGSGERETMLIDSQDGSFTFKAWKDPDGFADPCDPNAGRIDLAPGIDVFVDYVTNDSGLVVTRSEDRTVDGRRAVRLGFGTVPALAPGCGPEGSVLQWISNPQPTGDWHLLHGLTDEVLVQRWAMRHSSWRYSGQMDRPGTSPRSTSLPRTSWTASASWMRCPPRRPADARCGSPGLTRSAHLTSLERTSARRVPRWRVSASWGHGSCSPVANGSPWLTWSPGVTSTRSGPGNHRPDGDAIGY